MAKNDTYLEGLSIAELEKHIALAERKLEKKRRAAVKDAQKEIDKIAKGLGVSADDLVHGSPAKRAKKAAKKSARKKKAAAVKVKYRNPENTEQTWTGRGRTPVWLREKLESGASLDDFLIK